MNANIIVLFFTVIVCIFSYGMAEYDPSDCNLSLETGPCKAMVPRFGYDWKAEECVSFIYGGCKGNKNNFQTMEECNETMKTMCQASTY